MTRTLSGINVGHVLGVGSLAFAASMILVMLVVFGYAFALGFEARGQPDQAEIQRFAKAIAPTLGFVLASVLAAGGAAWVAARAAGRLMWHGVLVGAVIATGVLAIELSQSRDVVDVAKVIPIIAAAWLGSALVHTSRRK